MMMLLKEIETEVAFLLSILIILHNKKSSQIVLKIRMFLI